VVRTGDTLVIPPGYMHAVFTEIDTITYGGNNFDIHYMEMHLKICGIEDYLNMPIEGRRPYFAELSLFALSYVYNNNETLSNVNNSLFSVKLITITMIKHIKQWLNISNENKYCYIGEEVREKIMEDNYINNVETLCHKIETLFDEEKNKFGTTPRFTDP
jgi:hypothetical protein